MVALDGCFDSREKIECGTVASGTVLSQKKREVAGLDKVGRIYAPFCW